MKGLVVNDMMIDPVCGASLHEKIARAEYRYEGHVYYFCGLDCKDEFVKAPDKYINKSSCISAEPAK